jgi:hypothetical protein
MWERQIWAAPLQQSYRGGDADTLPLGERVPPGAEFVRVLDLPRHRPEICTPGNTVNPAQQAAAARAPSFADGIPGEPFSVFFTVTARF